MLDKTGEFFDKNIDFYGKTYPRDYDYYFLDFIKARRNHSSNLLDIGGGTGTFASLAINYCPNVDVTVLDPSQESLNIIKEEKIRKVKGSLPNHIFLNSRFDYIHIKQVFHHITGSNGKKTKGLLRESLLTIKNRYLNNSGFLLIHELFYESYIIPSLSRDLIFYLLALQNKLGVKIPNKEFLMDLQVYFYSRQEFRSILEDCGFRVVHYREENWPNDFRKKALFLRDWGRMLFILNRA